MAHQPGRHCASTGIRDLLHHHGIDWSEPMCFGLGAGLGIWYVATGPMEQSPLVYVRAEDLESHFFTRLGAEFAWEQFGNPQDAEAALCAHLRAGRPALIRTDVAYLPYFKTDIHFPGYVIVVWGFDSGRQVFWVSDTARAAAQEVPFEALRRARHYVAPIFSLSGHLYAPARLDPPRQLAKLLRGAIRFNSRVLLQLHQPYAGIAALRTWQLDLARWRTLIDWRWTARFAYQNIERRGTGGGGFRLMYAEFLEEAQELVPEITPLGLVARMRACGQAWQALAEALHAASEAPRPAFAGVGRTLDAVIRAETDYHRAAVSLPL